MRGCAQGVQYVLFNLIGSTLFLFALGAIYAETGTLNMADLAQRVQLISAEETVGIRVAAVLLLLVFAIKAAVVPLHFWLPSSYAEAPAPVRPVCDHDQRSAPMRSSVFIR